MKQVNGHAPHGLVGPDGRTALRDYHATFAKSAETHDTVFDRVSRMMGADTFASALADTTSLSSSTRAADPLRYHAWVQAAASIVATAQCEAPLRIFREGAKQEAKRKRAVEESGYQWKGYTHGGPRHEARQYREARGERRALDILTKGIEPVDGHPAANLFYRPNPMMSGPELMMALAMWFPVRGEAFVIRTGPDAAPIGPTTMPSEIWPVRPDDMEPIREHSSYGKLVGWKLQVPDYLPRSKRHGFNWRLRPDEVGHVKFPNPYDPTRGMSRITAAAQSVLADTVAKTYAVNTLRRGGIPPGFLENEKQQTQEQMDLFRERWSALYNGEQNAGRIGVLHNGWQFKPALVTARDMEYLGMLQWNRAEVLALLGVPESILIAGSANFATALAEDLGFWQKTILPMLKLFEAMWDRLLFGTDSSRVFPMYDVSAVAAFRAGLTEKLAQAQAACGDALHMPPDVALALVGLEVPAYEGSDVAFVGGTLRTAEQVIDGPPETVGDELDDEDLEDDVDDPADADDQRPESKAARSSKKVHQARFLRYHRPIERDYTDAMQAWIRDLAEESLDQLDAIASKKSLTHGEIRRILFDTREAGLDLRQRTFSILHRAPDAAAKIMAEELRAVLEITDAHRDAMLSVVDKRLGFASSKIPRSLRRRLDRTLRSAAKQGLTIAEIRGRVAAEFATASGRARAVAATEATSVINAAKAELMRSEATPDVRKEWIDSADERVRMGHRAIGRTGAKRLGFNYAPTGGYSGILEYPGDQRSEARAVVNCRCTIVSRRMSLRRSNQDLRIVSTA